MLQERKVQEWQNFSSQTRILNSRAWKHLCLPLPKKALIIMRYVGKGAVQMSPSLAYQADSLVPQTFPPSGLISKRERVVLRRFSAKVGRQAHLQTLTSNV